MAKINSFEDLLVWQKSREFVGLIYKITKKFPSDEKYGLIDQLRRASVSVMANIAEGFSRYHSTETIMFYRTARGSLSEIKSHLYISCDLGYIAKSRLEELIGLVDETGKMLNGLINTTRSFRKTKN